jgi:hypothetical protein
MADQRLERRADVVEVHLLGVQATGPLVCTWYLSFWLRSLAPYFSFIAIAQIRRATRPMTVYSGSIPLEKKKDRFGAKSSIVHPSREVRSRRR